MALLCALTRKAASPLMLIPFLTLSLTAVASPSVESRGLRFGTAHAANWCKSKPLTASWLPLYLAVVLVIFFLKALKHHSLSETLGTFNNIHVTGVRFYHILK